jgi:NADH-quinone oxidoreductase subunit I
MNCGFCAESCPFDAIRMDHNYELANTDKYKTNIFTLDKLLKPASYYASIRPTSYSREEAARAEKAASKAAKPS